MLEETHTGWHTRMPQAASGKSPHIRTDRQEGSEEDAGDTIQGAWSTWQSSQGRLLELDLDGQVAHVHSVMRQLQLVVCPWWPHSTAPCPQRSSLASSPLASAPVSVGSEQLKGHLCNARSQSPDSRGEHLMV